MCIKKYMYIKKYKSRNLSFFFIISKSSINDEEESLIRDFFLISNLRYATMTRRQKDDRGRRNGATRSDSIFSRTP